jgi:hypothetical protein
MTEGVWPLLEKQSQEIFTAVYAYKTRTDNFRVSKKFSDFEHIKKWEYIWRDGSELVYARNTGRVLFARDRNQVGVEGFIELTPR